MRFVLVSAGSRKPPTGGCLEAKHSTESLARRPGRHAGLDFNVFCNYYCRYGVSFFIRIMSGGL